MMMALMIMMMVITGEDREDSPGAKRFLPPYGAKKWGFANQCNSRDDEELNAVVFVEPEFRHSQMWFHFILVILMWRPSAGLFVYFERGRGSKAIRSNSKNSSKLVGTGFSYHHQQHQRHQHHHHHYHHQGEHLANNFGPHFGSSISLPLIVSLETNLPKTLGATILPRKHWLCPWGQWFSKQIQGLCFCFSINWCVPCHRSIGNMEGKKLPPCYEACGEQGGGKAGENILGSVRPEIFLEFTEHLFINRHRTFKLKVCYIILHTPVVWYYLTNVLSPQDNCGGDKVDDYHDDDKNKAQRLKWQIPRSRIDIS